MSPVDRRILAVTCLGHFLTHVNMLVFPALVLPLAAHLDMPMAAVLGISFWMYLLFGVTALPWGLLADRWGAPPLLLLYHLGSALCCLAAARWIDDAFMLSLALAGLGLFSGIYHPAGLGWISKRLKRVSLGLAYNGMFGNLGVAAAPLLAGFTNYLWGPGMVYVVVAGFNVVGALSILVSPRRDREAATETRDGGDSGMLVPFVILLVAMMLGGVVYRGATVIFPAYLEMGSARIFQQIAGWAGGVSANVAATTVASLVYLVGMLGQYTGGQVAERFELKRGYLAFHVLVAVFAFLLSLVSNVPLVLLALAYFFCLFGMQPIENSLVARLTPKRFHHAAYGTKFVLTFGVGAAAVQMLGFIEVEFGMGAAFPSLGIVSLALIAAIAVLIRRTPDILPRRS